MKHWRCIWVLVAVWLGGFATFTQAQTLDEQYVRIYNLIQQADAHASAGEPTTALARYLEAQTALKRLQQAYPDWNPRLVTFRLDYIEQKMAKFAAPSPNGRPAVSGTNAGPAAAAPPGTLDARRPADPQVAELREQVRLLQNDKLILEAKLKEALAARPAAIDPRELNRAEDRIRSLTKENALLKASLASAPTQPVANLGESAGRRAEASESTKALRAENELLKKQVTELRAATPSRRTTQLQERLSEAEARYAALQSDVEILKLEKEALQNQVRSMTNTVTQAIALRQEDLQKIQKLETERNDWERRATLAAAAPPPVGTPGDGSRVRELEQENTDLRRQLSTRSAPTGARPEDALRLRQLELERDQLKRDLDAANVKLAGRDNRASARRLEQLTADIETLQARVQVYEARAVPYTQAELALFQAPAPAGPLRESSPAPPNPNRELPATGASLAAEAQRHVANRDLAKAEASYEQMLRLDTTNTHTLTRLAALQMEQGKVDEAERNLRAAVDVDPKDPDPQALLGMLYFQRQKFDEALDVLGRAARLDPNNAEIQNYLGMTLSEKGLRGPAETALRKAVELDPNSGSAHNNLAVIYLTQNPPLVELARWHYQKALAARHPRNPDLEKMLEAKSPAK